MARSTRTKRRIADDDDPDDEEGGNEEEEEDNRNIVEGNDNNDDNDKKEAVDEAPTKQSSSSLADRQKKRMLDKLAKAAAGSNSRSNSSVPKKQKTEGEKEVKSSTPAIPKKKNVATDDKTKTGGGESGQGEDGPPSSLLAGMGLKPVPSMQQQKYQQRRPPSAAAAGRGSGPTTTATGRPYHNNHPNSNNSDGWKRRERPSPSRSPNRDRPGGSFPPAPHVSSTAATASVAGVAPHPNRQQNDSSTQQNSNTTSAANNNSTKNPQKIKSELMIMKALGDLCQEMKQNISRAGGGGGGGGGSGNIHDPFGPGSRSMGGDAPAVDLSGSFLRSKVVNDQDKYDFFDLDDDGGIVLQPTIPMFPEDFPPGQKEWPLSWWGIVDPALADAERDAKRIKDKDQKKNHDDKSDDVRNRPDGGGVGGMQPPRHQDRHPFYSREEIDRYNRSSRSRDRHDPSSQQYQRQFPPFEGPGHRVDPVGPGPDGRRGGPDGGSFRPQHPRDHGGPPEHMHSNHGGDFRRGEPPAPYGSGQQYGPGHRGGRGGGGRGRGRGGPPPGWRQHPNPSQPVGSFRGGRGGRGGGPGSYGGRPPPQQQQHQGRQDRDSR